MSYGDVISVDYLELPFSIYWRLFYVVFGATFLSYLFMTTGQHLLRPTIISMYNYAQPVVATFVSGDRIAVGVDARDGYVAVNGWKELSAEKENNVGGVCKCRRACLSLSHNKNLIQ